MHIKYWPVDERPREKLLELGPGRLSDAELLAIFLGSGIRGEDAVKTARNLLDKAGKLRGLLDRDAGDMKRLIGLGPARACKLSAALELNRRHLWAGLERGAALSNAQDAGNYFSARLRPHKQEVFAVLFLDTKHRAIAFEELFSGTIDRSQVHPREVVRRALAHNAAAVIVGHNHPSGHAEPSAADRSLTRRLHEALGLVDIRLLDHFVIGDGLPVSMASRGLL
ncbi:MAG TPA: DNA repair protein RadC [Stenotrophomonas sp.]|nr:DNA repair protein RadC [Stenotrophomonas sp.]